MCKKGDIYWADLPEMKDSHIQQGFRPILIYSNQKAIDNSPVFQYIPLTTEIKKTSLPVHVVLTSDCLLQKSMALVEGIDTIDKHRLREKMGTLSDYDIMKIDRAALIQLGIDTTYLFNNIRMQKVG